MDIFCELIDSFSFVFQEILVSQQSDVVFILPIYLQYSIPSVCEFFDICIAFDGEWLSVEDDSPEVVWDVFVMFGSELGEVAGEVEAV